MEALSESLMMIIGEVRTQKAVIPHSEEVQALVKTHQHLDAEPPVHPRLVISKHLLQEASRV